LWIALPEEEPARVILGSHGRTKSAILAPDKINYLDVQLAAGESWTYQPPPDHDVAWLAVAGELIAFEANQAIIIEADRASRFVLGSAAKHPHELIMGRYSAHTSRAALADGESEIQRIGHQLMTAGLLR
jgi:redox-sensitive bicupin YhaK (pirin superfamily)